MQHTTPRIDARIALHARAGVAAHAADAAQISAEAARVVDPVLTTAARGYRHPAHVRHWLLPRVRVSARVGRRIEFDRTDFRRVNARRAYGATTQRVHFGHEGQKFALEPYRLLGAQPVETAGRVTPIGPRHQLSAAPPHSIWDVPIDHVSHVYVRASIGISTDSGPRVRTTVSLAAPVPNAMMDGGETAYLRHLDLVLTNPRVRLGLADAPDGD